MVKSKNYSGMRNLFFLGLILMILLGCRKDPASPTPSSSEWYPMATGNYWVYFRTNNLTNSSDTIKIEVVEKGVSYGGKENLWRLEQTTYSSNQLENEFFISYSEDSIIYYKKDFSLNLIGEYKIVFSKLNEGDVWNFGNSSDVYEVININYDISVYGVETSEQTIFLNREYQGFNAFLQEHLYVTKTIGVTVRNIVEYDQGFYSRNDLLVLIDYNLN